MPIKSAYHKVLFSTNPKTYIPRIASEFLIGMNQGNAWPSVSPTHRIDKLLDSGFRTEGLSSGVEALGCMGLDLKIYSLGRCYASRGSPRETPVSADRQEAVTSLISY